MPGDWVVHREDKVRHVVPDVFLAVLKEDAGPVRQRQRPVSRKPDQNSSEEVIVFLGTPERFQK
jgi:hypothetical protein